MKKRLTILTLLLLLSLVILVFSSCEADPHHTHIDTDENGICDECAKAAPRAPDESILKFTLNEDEASYTVSGLLDPEAKAITIPETHLGLPVTAIGEKAFNSYPSDDLGGCIRWSRYMLESVYIPGSVKVIEDYAFQNCEKLKKNTKKKSMLFAKKRWSKTE